jgi:hypothetical protein
VLISIQSKKNNLQKRKQLHQAQIENEREETKKRAERQKRKEEVPFELDLYLNYDRKLTNIPTKKLL